MTPDFNVNVWLTLPQSSRAPTVGDSLTGVDSGPGFLGLAGRNVLHFNFGEVRSCRVWYAVKSLVDAWGSGGER